MGVRRRGKKRIIDRQKYRNLKATAYFEKKINEQDFDFIFQIMRTFLPKKGHSKVEYYQFKDKKTAFILFGGCTGFLPD